MTESTPTLTRPLEIDDQLADLGAEQTGLNPVVEYNLSVLNSGAMQNLISSESRGGNAGVVEIGGEKVSCVGINGYLDGQTGRISALGNYQDLDPKITERDETFLLRLANSQKTLRDTIVEFSVGERLEPEGKENFLTTVRAFNQLASERSDEKASKLKKEHGSAILRFLGYQKPN